MILRFRVQGSDFSSYKGRLKIERRRNSFWLAREKKFIANPNPKNFALSGRENFASGAQKSLFYRTIDFSFTLNYSFCFWSN